MIGKTISHYKILEELGRGGMGVVYKAQDTKLKRTVALKFLPPELTREPKARQRFIHEAQAASALEHPNICTIYEIDETDDDQMFIVMACYDGELLKEKIERGPLKLEKAIDIAMQTAEGLARAHESGITHRDIKSANVMVTKRGEVKILDFGLAKLAGQVVLTRTGTIMGTVAYMSPEQARGEEVDHKTDIWSLGVVIYEMLTGQLPFKGDYEQAVVYAILNEEPKSLVSLRQDTPPNLEQIVSKSLEKDPAMRYQSIQEVLEELRMPLAVISESEKREKSIIVLPFENISPDPEQEYFSDGLTEEIITDLSQIHDLLAISRSSAMTFKGTRKKIKEIAREVNVRYVLEGSVRKAGNNLRITAQLIDATTDAHLWAEKYSGKLGDVFEIQEKVSRSIVDALEVKLSPKEDKKIAERPIDDVSSYEQYLKAIAEIYKFTEEAFDRALRHLKKARDILGDNAYIYAAMAWAYWNYFNIGAGPEDCHLKAVEYAQKALELDPEFPKAHAILGWHYCAHGGEQQKALSHFKRALAANPDETIALEGFAVMCVCVNGNFSIAAQLCERMRRINPLNKIVIWVEGAIHFYDGRFSRALPIWKRWYELEPESPFSLFYHALALTYNNRFEEAVPVIDQNAKVNPGHLAAKFGLMMKYGLQGEREKAHQEMTPQFQETCKWDPPWAHHVASFLALLGDKEGALDWLERAVDIGFIIYPFLAEKDPFLENIRGEGRFKKLMERVKHEWENFEV